MGRSTKGADYQDIPRPIAALADEYAPGHHDPHHHHKRAQLIYACAGVTVVDFTAGSGLVNVDTPEEYDAIASPGAGHFTTAPSPLS